MLVDQHYASMPPPTRLNQQGDDLGNLEYLRRRGTHTGCIQPVCLGQVESTSVVFRPSSTAHFDGQPRGLELFKQVPSRRVDGCRVSKRSFGLRKQTRQPLWPLRQEDPDLLRALGLIAGFTGERQIADPIGATPGLRLDMLYLERHVLLTAICTGALKFL